MFKDDDEDDDAGALGATRYPCMPSLVALQQMRNRLHLAYVGKKLMKWTAMATGREMRRMAAEINETHTSFYEDVRDAFMYLARSRYFIQDLNQMVVENVHGQAHATVSTVNKTISGVKVLQFEVLEEGPECYEHLGIARGGKAVEDAKEAWIALLRRIIFMLELRTSFGLVEMANKSATKKQNVLGKIIIPRIQKTIIYIQSELEEKEREETFRLKRVKQKKERDSKKIQLLQAKDAAGKKVDPLRDYDPADKKSAKAKPIPLKGSGRDRRDDADQGRDGTKSPAERLKDAQKSPAERLKDAEKSAAEKLKDGEKSPADKLKDGRKSPTDSGKTPLDILRDGTPLEQLKDGAVGTKPLKDIDSFGSLPTELEPDLITESGEGFKDIPSKEIISDPSFESLLNKVESLTKELDKLVEEGVCSICSSSSYTGITSEKSEQCIRKVEFKRK